VVSDPFQRRLLEAKAAGKPVCIHVVAEESGFSKWFNQAILSQPEVSAAAQPFVFIRLVGESPEGQSVRSAYHGERSPLLSVLNTEGDLVETLDLPPLEGHQQTPALASLVARWLESAHQRFSQFGPLGYARKNLDAADPIRAIHNRWRARPEADREKSTLLLYQAAIEIGPDGVVRSRKRRVFFVGESSAGRGFEWSYAADQPAHLRVLHARTLTPEGKENAVPERDLEPRISHQDQSGWKEKREIRFRFPGATPGCLAEVEYEEVEQSNLPAPLFILSMDSVFEDADALGALEHSIEVKCPEHPPVRHRTFGHPFAFHSQSRNGVLTLHWSRHSEQPPATDDGIGGGSSGVVVANATIEDIGRRFLSLADSARKHTAEMDAWIDAIAAAVVPGKDYEKRVTNAFLEAIRARIRYALPGGEWRGIAPQPASDTFHGRSGDCKAQSVFLQECLRRAGLHCDLVLVGAGASHELNEDPPTRRVLNHVFVRVHAGKEFFDADPVAHGFGAGTLPAASHDAPALLCARDQIVAFQTPPMTESDGVELEARFSDLDLECIRVNLRLRSPAGAAHSGEISGFPAGLRWESSLTPEKSFGGNLHAPFFEAHFNGVLRPALDWEQRLLCVPGMLVPNGAQLGLPRHGDAKAKEATPGLFKEMAAPRPFRSRLIYQLPPGFHVCERPAALDVSNPFFVVRRTIQERENQVIAEVSITPKRVPGPRSFVPETELPRDAQNLMSRLLSPIILSRDPGVLLLRAAESGPLEKVQALLESGTVADHRDADGNTALLLAAHRGRADIVELLLRHGASIDAVNSKKETALFRALDAGKPEAARVLLDHGADTQTRTEAGLGLLMAAAGHENEAPILQELIHRGLDVNLQCHEGTALLRAVQKDNHEAVRILLAAGADPCLRASNKEGVQQEHPGTVLGACAEAPEKIETLRLLLRLGVDVHCAGPDGATALLRAAECGNTPALEVLIGAGALVNHQNALGSSALMLAAQNHHTAALECLLRHHADPNLRDFDGQTALMYCANYGSADAREKRGVLAALVSAGADVDLKDHDGQTALTLGGARGMTPLVTFLAEKGARRREPRLIAFPKRAQPLPRAVQWAQALAALYFLFYEKDAQYLGGAETPDAEDARTRLDEDWNVRSREQLLIQLQHQRDIGAHLTLQEAASAWPLLEGAQWDLFLERTGATPLKKQRLGVLRNYFRKWGGRSGLANDWCRFVYLANLGFAAGFLSEKETTEEILAVARHAQKTFGSWIEFHENQQEGLKTTEEPPDPRWEALGGLLSNPRDPESPWNQNSWRVPLGDAGL
jgi:ankyrin repeat protein